MMATSQVPVLVYAVYHGPDDQSSGTQRHFCGACRRGISGIHGHNDFGKPEYPEDVLAKGEVAHGFLPLDRDDDREYGHYLFCPWCGVQFEDDWWTREKAIIQNERAIDHFRHPGWHKGDSHVFASDTPDPGAAMANHWLGVSGGDRLCWCDPQVTPDILGCEIRHNTAKSYEAVMAAEQAKRDQDQAAARANSRDVPR